VASKKAACLPEQQRGFREAPWLEQTTVAPRKAAWLPPPWLLQNGRETGSTYLTSQNLLHFTAIGMPAQQRCDSFRFRRARRSTAQWPEEQNRSGCGQAGNTQNQPQHQRLASPAHLASRAPPLLVSYTRIARPRSESSSQFTVLAFNKSSSSSSSSSSSFPPPRQPPCSKSSLSPRSLVLCI